MIMTREKTHGMGKSKVEISIFGGSAGTGKLET